jgi:regulator of replication initiation timing
MRKNQGFQAATFAHATPLIKMRKQIARLLAETTKTRKQTGTLLAEDTKMRKQSSKMRKS